MFCLVRFWLVLVQFMNTPLWLLWTILSSELDGFGWRTTCHYFIYLYWNYSFDFDMYCSKSTSFQWFFLILHEYSLCSGEKTAAKDWPGFLEIKGRVRLDAFEKFLQDLRQSRSRAIMVSQVSFCCARARFEYCLLISPPSIKKTKKGKNVAVWCYFIF